MKTINRRISTGFSFSKSSFAYLAEGFPEVLREERVQDGVDAGTAIGQHVRRHLEGHVKVRVGVEERQAL